MKNDPDAAPERRKTDAGLRDERHNTDRALADKNDGPQFDAKAIVQKARFNADALLAGARRKVDEDGIANRDVVPVLPTAIAAERAVEDAVLRDEREQADETLRMARETAELVLTRHLLLERHATDEFLRSERLRADEALASRDDFLGMVCHDVRGLLNGIVVSSAILGQRAAKQGELGDLAETSRIQRYAARMNHLISDLVDVVSIDAGKLSTSAKPGDALALVAEALEALRTPASIKGLSLEAEPCGISIHGEFDHDRLLQVLRNLIANSIKFTPEGGSIRVTCEQTDAALTFSVVDTGQGIPEDKLVSVFERYAQVGKDRGGLGLGLYISRCIVESHGGSIRAESVLGQGTSVSFTLPKTSGAELPGTP